MNLVLQIVLCVIIPLYFFRIILKSSIRNFPSWLLTVSFVGSYIFFLFFIIFWPFGLGYFWGYFLLMTFMFCVIKSCFNKKKDPLGSSITKITGFCVTFFCLIFFLWQIIMINLPHHGKSITLDFPLKNGHYYIAQGGDNSIINHHHHVQAQKYALDIVKINNFGFRASKLIPKELNDYYIFNTPVYSPVDGEIVETADFFDDLIPPNADSSHPGGNYIVIKAKDSTVLIILAHLRKGSVLVSKNMEVFKGQELARVGNSGNTSEPHLHIHSVLQDTGDFFFNDEGIQMIFDGKFLVRNDIIKK